MSRRDDAPKGKHIKDGKAGPRPGAKGAREKPFTKKPNSSGYGKGEPPPPSKGGSGKGSFSWLVTT